METDRRDVEARREGSESLGLASTTENLQGRLDKSRQKCWRLIDLEIIEFASL